jgi:molecular chaperone GrpE
MPDDETNPTPEPAPNAGAATEPQTAEARIAELEAEVASLKDRWLRAEAETQNLRSRTAREVQDARNFAVQRFASDMAEAAENLRRALDAMPAADDPESPIGKLRGGVEGLERAFVAALERHGVQRVEAQGRPFDPERHQAMAEQPAPEGVEPGTVLQAWSSAWTLNGRLLRPAMVVVAGKG